MHVCTYRLNAAPAEVLKFDLTAVVHLDLEKQETTYALHFDARVRSYFGFFRGFIWSEPNRNNIQQLPAMAHGSKLAGLTPRSNQQNLADEVLKVATTDVILACLFVKKYIILRSVHSLHK